MPTLFRFILTLSLLAALVYGVMLALVTFVKPNTVDISVEVPLDQLAKEPSGP